MRLAPALRQISTNVRFLTGAMLLPEFTAALLEAGIATRAAAEFIAGDSGVASLAAPALPDPAPLY
jgi:hypothetical protein